MVFSLASSSEERLYMMSVFKVLWKIFGPKRDREFRIQRMR
jgi:hypothetical protein